MTAEYAVRASLAAAVAASFRTGLKTVPDRPPAATAAATSSSSTPTAGAASSLRASLGTVPVRSPATAAATSSSSTPTAGAASSFLTLDRTAAVAAVSISLCTATAAASFRAGLGAVPVRFRAVVVVVAAVVRLASCGKITYVAGSCSRASALRAAADGRAV